jgi:hypothetical protein
MSLFSSPVGPSEEITLYVKGFRGGSTEESFSRWYRCHRHLVRSHGWGERAIGYAWNVRHALTPAPPIGAALRLVQEVARSRRTGEPVSPWRTLAVALGEQGMWTAMRLAQQYRDAAQAALGRAHELAERLRELTERWPLVRVVAHSLGCLQTIEAMQLLDPAQRPGEVHLCGPACREADVERKLAVLPGGRSAIYFARGDLVLGTAFRALSRGPAIGSAGLEGGYPGLVSVDVGEHFSFFVHREYSRRFGRFALRFQRDGSARRVD